jgi:hypothetical protein
MGLLEFLGAVVLTVAVFGSIVAWHLWESLTPREKWSFKDNARQYLGRLK